MIAPAVVLARSFVAASSIDPSLLIVGGIAVGVTLGRLVLRALNRARHRSKQPSTIITRGAGSHFRSDGRPKVTYRTQSEAQAAALRDMHRFGESVNPYKCSDCTGWHVGHARQTQRGSGPPRSRH